MKNFVLETNNTMENNQNGAWGAAANKLAGALADPQTKNGTKAVIMTSIIAVVAGVGLYFLGKMGLSTMELLKQKE